MDEEKSRAKTKRRKEGTHERMMIGNDDGVDLYEFDVSGMSCGTCAEWVTDAIKKNVDDVVEVDAVGEECREKCCGERRAPRG